MNITVPMHKGTVLLPQWRTWALEGAGLLVRHLSLQLPAMGLFFGALANLPLCFMTAAMGSEDLQPWRKLAVGYTIPVAVVSGLAGIAAFIALRHRGSARLQPEAASEPTHGERQNRWVLLVGAALFGLSAWVVSRFAAVVDLARYSFDLLSGWGMWDDLGSGGQYAGLGLLAAVPFFGVPILEGMATLVLVGGLAAASLLYFARSRRLAGTCVAAMVLLAAFVLDSHFTIQFLRRSRQLVEASLAGEPQATSVLDEWFARHERAVVPMLQSLACTLGVSIVVATLLLRPRFGRSHLERTHASWDFLAGSTDAEKSALGLPAVETLTEGQDARRMHFRRRTMK